MSEPILRSSDGQTWLHAIVVVRGKLSLEATAKDTFAAQTGGGPRSVVR